MFSTKFKLVLFSLFGALAKGDLQSPSNLTAVCTVTKYSQISDAVASCTNIVISDLNVPTNQRVNLTLKDGDTLTFRGTTTFAEGTLDGWLLSISGNNINVIGEEGSLVHGNGQLYWDGQGGAGGKTKPSLLNIKNVNNATFKGISLKNCPMFCTGINQADGVNIDGWTTDCSEGDPNPDGSRVARNTDGIGISWAKNIVIKNAYIHNQDQCVYVNQGSDMYFSNLHCVESNGICATAGFSENDVEENTTRNITFHNCVMEGGLTGVQIITMKKPGGGPGQVSDITFENVILKDVKKQGIYIQTDFGDEGHSNDNLDVKNIKFSNITGTVLPEAAAVRIFCSKKCSNIILSDVEITGSNQTNSCNYQPIGFNC